MSTHIFGNHNCGLLAAARDMAKTASQSTALFRATSLAWFVLVVVVVCMCVCVYVWLANQTLCFVALFTVTVTSTKPNVSWYFTCNSLKAGNSSRFLWFCCCCSGFLLLILHRLFLLLLLLSELIKKQKC